jgi:hypothetical protein
MDRRAGFNCYWYMKVVGEYQAREVVPNGANRCYKPRAEIM